MGLARPYLSEIMSIANFSISAPSPTVDELVTSANKIGALVRQFAERTEADRQVSSEVIERMREAGLFRIMQPAEYGGYEYGFEALIRVVAAVAAGCCSSGWVVSLGIVHQWLIAAYSDPNAIAFGSYAPVGKAVAVDGGYRLVCGVSRADAIMGNGLCLVVWLRR